MEYNYVFYGITNDFYRHSFKDLSKLDNIICKRDIFDSKISFLYWLYRLHTYPGVKIKLPFTSIWNKFSIDLDFNNEKPVCFIFMPKHVNRKSYFYYIRKKYPNSKLVLMFRDKVEANCKWFPNLNIGEIKNIFDEIYSYNKYDCANYGFKYFNLEASKEKVCNYEDQSDVVFIGSAKDRIEKIIGAYKKFLRVGLKCDFYIVGAPREKAFHGEGITFSNKNISYSEMLRRECASKCILEISQSGEYGFTTRAQEAFMYDKKLITDSRIVKEQKFYNPKFVQVFDNIDEIDCSFVNSQEEPNYGYNGEYSPIQMIKKLDFDLAKEKEYE